MSNFFRSLISRGTPSRTSCFAITLMAAGGASYFVTEPTLKGDERYKPTALRGPFKPQTLPVLGSLQMTLFAKFLLDPIVARKLGECYAS